MGKRIKTAQWRVFLKALARTGNVRTAAAEAGMDAATAYDRRARDRAFAQTWAAAVAKALARPSKKPSAKGAELIERRSKRLGTQLVRAAEGRWNKATEEDFLAALARTGSVTSAAAAIGFSTNALYMRKEHYPDFAERWDRAKGISIKRLPDLLHAASIAALDPDVEGRDLPPVNVDQAIRISKMSAPPPGRRGALIPASATAGREEVEAQAMAVLAKLKRRTRRGLFATGWSEARDGTMVPPGWVYRGPADGEWAPGEG